jgi:flagellin
MAKEMSNFTRNQIMMESSVAMLAQSNARPLQVLKLLQ